MQYQETIGKIYTCAFTGHRTLGKDFNARNLVEYIEMLVKNGVTVFYNGVARGFDLLAAEAVLMFKGRYPQIKLIACVPHEGQEAMYSNEEKARYYAVLKKADETVVLSETYYKGCMQKRNEYMVDRADVLIAYANTDKGGTANTVRYCKRKYPHKQILFI